MRRVIAVGMFDSVHFGRWLDQFKDEPIEFLLFPSSPHRRLHPLLKDLTTGAFAAKFSLFMFSRFMGLPLWIVDQIAGNRVRGFLLRRAIETFSPNYVHALEMQNAGYIALAALEKQKPEDVKLIVTNYGSDIYWFSKFPKHRTKIVRLLSIADYYACECQRDVQLARELDFTGIIMPVMPNAGGFSEEVLRQPLIPGADRKYLAIKGYQGWVGRAHSALAALRLLRPLLEDFQIVVYSCNFSTVLVARRLRRETGLRITAFRKGQLSHSQVLELFSKSAIYVGISESDGISTSLLEAMAMGAIPVQTSTACSDEWFQNTGVTVKEIEVESISTAITAALKMVCESSHQVVNRETVRLKASKSTLLTKALSFYR